jgi:hypothetical protein
MYFGMDEMYRKLAFWVGHLLISGIELIKTLTWANLKLRVRRMRVRVHRLMVRKLYTNARVRKVANGMEEKDPELKDIDSSVLRAPDEDAVKGSRTTLMKQDVYRPTKTIHWDLILVATLLLAIVVVVLVALATSSSSSLQQ